MDPNQLAKYAAAKRDKAFFQYHRTMILTYLFKLNVSGQMEEYFWKELQHILFVSVLQLLLLNPRLVLDWVRKRGNGKIYRVLLDRAAFPRSIRGTGGWRAMHAP